MAPIVPRIVRSDPDWAQAMETDAGERRYYLANAVQMTFCWMLDQRLALKFQLKFKSTLINDGDRAMFLADAAEAFTRVTERRVRSWVDFWWERSIEHYVSAVRGGCLAGKHTPSQVAGKNPWLDETALRSITTVNNHQLGDALDAIQLVVAEGAPVQTYAQYLASSPRLSGQLPDKYRIVGYVGGVSGAASVLVYSAAGAEPGADEAVEAARRTLAARHSQHDTLLGFPLYVF